MWTARGALTAQFIRSPKARQDVLEIADYIARDDPRLSIKFIDSVEKAYAQLERNPELGSRLESNRKELAGLRIWPMTDFRNHAIIYRITGDIVEVVRVIRALRDLNRLSI